MEKITVIARNYQWTCGDGCCSESKQRYEFKYGEEYVHFDNIYCEPAETKEQFISAMKQKGTYDIFEAIKKRLLLEVDEIPEKVLKLLYAPFSTLGEILEQIEFEYVYTLDEYD